MEQKGFIANRALFNVACPPVPSFPLVPPSPPAPPGLPGPPGPLSLGIGPVCHFQ